MALPRAGRLGGWPAASLSLLLLVLTSALPVANARGAAARSASSSSGGTNDAATTAAELLGTLTAVVDKSAAAVAARAAVVATVLPNLRGLTLRCADISIMRTGSVTTDTGDGFARLDLNNLGLSDLMADIYQTPVNGTYPLDPSVLDGANVWLLQYIAAAGQMTFTYETVFLSDALFYQSNRTTQLDYVFNTLGYDCLITSTVLRGERMATADYLVANERFGLSVVTSLSAAQEYPTKSMLFAWTEPFAWEIWVTVFSALLFGAIAMYFFEGDDCSEDYGSTELPLVLRIARGWYKAFLNFSSVGGFNPNTPAGQMFNITFSFAMLLLQAAYTANLAAFFTRTQAASSPITSMSSFGGKQLTACVLNDPYVLNMLRSAFPLTKFNVLPSALTSDLIDAIDAGTCAGGIATDLQLRYALGPQDPLGEHCNMQLAGGLLSQNYYAIPFNLNSPRINSTVMGAMNAIAANAFAYGDYAVGASMTSFPNERPACAGYSAAPAANALTALNIRQVSGIFFLLLFGFGAALLLYGAFVLKGVGKVSSEHGTALEEALRARHEAELQALRADIASGLVDGRVDTEGGTPMKASSALWLKHIQDGGAAGSTLGAVGGLGAAALGGGAASGISSMTALEAMAAALAREAAAVMDVPARTTAAVEKALAERGAYLVCTLRMCDAKGNVFGGEIPTAPLTRAGDWQFLYTRLETEQSARFNRAVRAVAAGQSAATAEVYATPPPKVSLPALAKQTKLATRSAVAEPAGLQEVVVMRAAPKQAAPARTSEPRRRRSDPEPAPAAAAPTAFASFRAFADKLDGRGDAQAPPPPAARQTRRTASAERRRGEERDDTSRPRSRPSGDRLSARGSSLNSHSAPPSKGRRQIPRFED